MQGQLQKRADDTLDMQQTLGDGVKYSQLTEAVTAPPSAMDGMLQGGSDAATKLIRREATGDECPPMFICARATTVTPVSGSPVTYCYQDQAGNWTVMPVAIATNFTAADYRPKTYGPFTVWQFAGDGVDCTNPGGNKLLALTSVNLQVTVTTEPASDWTEMRYHQRNVIPVQYEVDMIYSKAGAGLLGSDDRRPYVDQTADLQGKTRFLMNEERQVLVKIVKSVRKGLALTGDSSSWLGAAAELILPFDGLSLDWEAELCRDALLPADSGTYCD
jgi:hypothetical protein